MSNPISNLINALINRQAGGNKRPVFFNIDETRPELLEVTRAFGQVRSEFESLLQKDLRPYHDIDPEQVLLSKGEKDWSLFLLHAMGYEPNAAQQYCPKTLELINTIPGLFQAFFSVLPAGKSIPLHKGSFKGYIRYHLALKVPNESAPILKVHDKEYMWTEGEAMLFDDTWPHEVVNNSKETRAVLVVDVLRPLNFPLSWLNELLAKTVIKHLYGKRLVCRANA